MFVCDKAFAPQSKALFAGSGVEVVVISAGKLRRYHNVSLWRQLLDFQTIGKNVVDSVKIVRGFFQSIKLLRRFKPDVVFAKGGYVSLPMGYAAHLLKIPLVIHDSDTRPGLTNGILSRYACAIATGSPPENYSYNTSISHYTGVPIGQQFHLFSDDEKNAAKQTLDIGDTSRPLLVITGGGLGAVSINTAIVNCAQELINAGFTIYHVTGKNNFKSVTNLAIDDPNYKVVDFVDEGMARLLGAADIVVSRGSATFLQELAALAKPTVVIPASQLSDQVKNAKVYQAAKAVVVLSDEDIRADSQHLYRVIDHLWSHKLDMNAMAHRFHTFARPDAAREVARLIHGARLGKN